MINIDRVARASPVAQEQYRHFHLELCVYYILGNSLSLIARRCHPSLVNVDPALRAGTYTEIDNIYEFHFEQRSPNNSEKN